MSEAAAPQRAVRARLSPASAAGEIAPVLAKPIVGEKRVGPRSTARDSGVMVLELCGLWAINKLGYAVVALLDLPLPGNVAGMLLLFGLLCAGIVPARLFERSSTLLARHLPFFFVPIAVGLMNIEGALVSQGWLLLLVLAASAAVGLCVTGWLAQSLSRLTGRR